MKKRERTGRINVRATQAELKMLKQLAALLGLTRRETIWLAVQELYNDPNREDLEIC